MPDAQGPDSLPSLPRRSSGVMARLTLSAVEPLVAKPGGWREPMVQRALLVSGLSVLLSSPVQNSIPAWALTPCSRKGWRSSFISVTRSARSSRPAGAPRPVSATWVSGGRRARPSST
jgi:hypothetical protein